MSLPKTDIKAWKKTDPDNFQFGRKFGKGIYAFKEFDRLTFMSRFYDLKRIDYEIAMKIIKCEFNCPDFWVESTIDLSKYSEEEKETHIEGYYDSMSALEAICGGDKEQVDWIVAECIFEQDCGLY
jgi:hypothetical protein